MSTRPIFIVHKCVNNLHVRQPNSRSRRDKLRLSCAKLRLAQVYKLKLGGAIQKSTILVGRAGEGLGEIDIKAGWDETNFSGQDRDREIKL